MRQFNTPPGWPDPPTARWRPPRHWQPKETWPPAPDGWAFWVDENGTKVRGPLGRFGGPSRIKIGAIAALPLALIGLVLFNPFGGGDNTASSTTPPRIGTTADATASSATPTTTPTSAPTTEATTPGQSQQPVVESGRTPTPTPTSTQSSTPVESPESEATTATATPAPTAIEPTPTSAPATTTVVYQDCAAVRAAGKAPLRQGDPGYSKALDRNGDGVACEHGNS